MMVSCRLEPVEIISIRHPANSSMRSRYRLASAGNCRYAVAPVVEALQPWSALPYRCRRVESGLEDVFVSLMENARDNYS